MTTTPIKLSNGTIEIKPSGIGYADVQIKVANSQLVIESQIQLHDLLNLSQLALEVFKECQRKGKP